jgi:hypothetical protein
MWQLKVDFEVKGKTYKCIVDKMRILNQRPEVFFRVSVKSGNRDLICHDGQWIVCRGDYLPDDLLDALGAGIEKALQEQL